MSPSPIARTRSSTASSDSLSDRSSMGALSVGTVATHGCWNAFAKRQQLAKAGLRAVLVLLKQLLQVTSQQIECSTNLGIENWIEAAITAVPKGEDQGACSFLRLSPCQADVVVVRHQRPAMESSWPLMGHYWMGTHDSFPWLIRCHVPSLNSRPAPAVRLFGVKEPLFRSPKLIYPCTDGLQTTRSQSDGAPRPCSRSTGGG